jgi:hypothetical protein
VGVTAAFLGGKQGCRLGLPPKQGPRPWDHGPLILVPQTHWGAISFSDRSDSIFRKHS